MLEAVVEAVAPGMIIVWPSVRPFVISVFVPFVRPVSTVCRPVEPSSFWTLTTLLLPVALDGRARHRQHVLRLVDDDCDRGVHARDRLRAGSGAGAGSGRVGCERRAWAKRRSFRTAGPRRPGALPPLTMCAFAW